MAETLRTLSTLLDDTSADVASVGKAIAERQAQHVAAQQLLHEVRAFLHSEAQRSYCAICNIQLQAPVVAQDCTALLVPAVCRLRCLPQAAAFYTTTVREVC